MNDMVGQPQSVQVPNYSGVNIQIFNPSVVAPGGAAPVSTVNSQSYSTGPSSYPPNYYTQNLNPTTAQASATATAGANGLNGKDAVASATDSSDKKKTEKRQIVELTDDYIKTLENYLNDGKNPQIRLMGAKEVIARLEEDPSRKDDVALNALINKMLQDPSQQVKFLAMAALNSRLATGDELSVQLLKGIQQQKTAYGQDSLMASDILLKMSGNTVEKEFEVKNKPAKKEKNEDKKA